MTRGRPESYPWAKLLDGQRHTMRRAAPGSTGPLEPDEFDIPVESFRAVVTNAARRKGVKVSTWNNGSMFFVIQAWDATTGRRPKLGERDVSLSARPLPTEYLCTICGALAGQWASDISSSAGVPTQCWIIENFSPIGPKHK